MTGPTWFCQWCWAEVAQYLAAEAIEALGRIGTPEALARVEAATCHR
jgi:hypothetical protein